MPDPVKAESLLAPYRILDLTDEKGFLCGKILSDMGADVIKIEPPGGDPARRIGPFYLDSAHPEKSLSWFAFNLGKRGITLDIETADGREIFTRLVKQADFVIESFAPGYMGSHGFSYEQLAQINPRVILVSITPFGQTGPRRDYKSCDIVNMALGGPMFVCGDTDRAPVRMSIDQSFLHASSQAAVGALIAHFAAKTSGRGQHVDVSIQDSLVWVPLYGQQAWYANKYIVGRAGVSRQRHDGMTKRYIWSCKDGWVCWWLTGGTLGHQTRALVEWMQEEGLASTSLAEWDWTKFDIDKQEQASVDRILDEFCRFFMCHTKAELYEEGLRRRALVYPVCSMADLLHNTQLDARRSWMQVDHPELGTSITYPGAFLKSSEDLKFATRRAPLIGEHNLEIYQGELGLSRPELVTLEQAGAI